MIDFFVKAGAWEWTSELFPLISLDSNIIRYLSWSKVPKTIRTRACGKLTETFLSCFPFILNMKRGYKLLATRLTAWNRFSVFIETLLWNLQYWLLSLSFVWIALGQAPEADTLDASWISRGKGTVELSWVILLASPADHILQSMNPEALHPKENRWSV